MNNYFNDFTPTQSDSFAPSVDTGLYRSGKTGDKIYLVRENTKHWITSPAVLAELGFNFGQEKDLDTLNSIQSGEPIRMDNVDQFKTPSDEALTNENTVGKAEGGVVEEINIGSGTIPLMTYPAHEVPEDQIPHVLEKGLTSIIISEQDVSLIEKLKAQFTCEIIVVDPDMKIKLGDKVVKDADTARRITTGEFVLILDHVKEI